MAAAEVPLPGPPAMELFHDAVLRNELTVFVFWRGLW